MNYTCKVNLISGQIGPTEMLVEPDFRPINKITLAKLSNIYFFTNRSNSQRYYSFKYRSVKCDRLLM